MSAEDEAFERFEEAQVAAETGELEDARAGFVQVCAILERLGTRELESEAGTLTWGMVVRNLAILGQMTEDWPAMREATTRLVTEEPDTADVHVLHAIALKHTGDVPAAEAAVRRAIALDPENRSAYHEHACQLAVAGQLEAALGRVEQALEHGSSPDDLKADDELAALRELPRFVELVSDAHQLAIGARRLRAIDAKLVGRDFDQEAIELYEAALPIARDLLELSGIVDLPRDDDGIVVVDTATAAQRELLESIIGCEALWHAIPFLNVLGDAGMPNLTPEDARTRLGLGGN